MGRVESMDGETEQYLIHLGDGKKNGWTWDVKMKWEDNSETWESLAVIWKSDSVALAPYAKEHDLLKTDGWKRLCHYVKNEKKFKHQMKQ
eukprot:4263830-Ditylum_brightwellii.AAC.1